VAVEIDIEVRGLDELIRRYGPDALQEPIERAMKEVWAFLEGKAKENLSNRGGAPNYLVGGRPVKNPTEWLRVQTGRLRSSVAHEVTRTSRIGYDLRVGTNVVYGRIHEYGGPALAWGKHLFYMPKRSFLQPAFDENKMEVLGMIQGRLMYFMRSR
jgi:phage gpG-like protein